ncbi:MAG: TetR/AcrR family transcriptional regulator [Gemmatimonadaceae bacterium]
MERPRELNDSATRVRLLQATVDCVRRLGVAKTSIKAVAREAGVSKALVLYHFGRKNLLLASTSEWLAGRSAQRETDALIRSDASRVLEDLWEWVAEELERGELVAAFEIARQHEPAVDAVTERASRERLLASEKTVAEVFSKLALRPRVPIALLATAQLAFVDGLAIQATQRPNANHRIAFDVFWLALLSLVE